ncbi:ABC transporter permease, partial [Bacillus paranthracis]|nr:ABC transporter permease [Bacillus paranthracis]
GAKYIFSVNLSLTDYLSGKLPALQGLSMEFSLMNLTVWAVVSLIISFVVFTKQDMVN